jgi:hypothetical protein
MKKTLFAATLLLAFAIVACSKKTVPGKTVEAPKVKLTTYAANVMPLIQAKCSPCHLPSKGGNKGSFETYASAKNFAADMVVRIKKNPGERGFMPFRQPKLSVEDIAVFEKWVSGGAPEN